MMARKPARKSKKLQKKRIKKVSWKLIKKNKRTKELLFRVLAIVIIFLISALSLFGFFIYKSITIPFVSASSASASDLTNEHIFTISYISVKEFSDKPLRAIDTSLIFFDKKNKKIIVYRIPSNLAVDVPGKFSEEEISKILALGNLSSDDLLEGVNILNRTLEKIFAYKVNRYLLVEDKLNNMSSDFLYKGENTEFINVKNIQSFKNSLKTNLNLSELYELYKFINSLPSDRFIIRDLSLYDVKNLDLIDEDIRDISFDSKVALEKKSITVLNGANQPGIASFGARVIENMGGRTIAVENAKDKYEESIIIVDSLESETVKYITDFFNIKNIVLKQDTSHINENEINRSDITIIIGVDIAQDL